MSLESELQQFIDAHVAVLEPLAREAALAGWELQTASSDAAREQVVRLNTRIAEIYSDRNAFAFLSGISQEEITDPLLARQHTLLKNAFLAHQMDRDVIAEIVTLETEIEDQFNNHRAMVRGREVSDNEVDSILLTSEDASLRREAWEASKTVGALVAERLLHLVRLRNREAKRLGFSDYYQMSLSLQELDIDRLFGLLDDLEQHSAPIWRQYREALDAQLATRYGITPAEVRPWHHANRFFQEEGPGQADLDRFFKDKDLGQLTDTFFSAIGLPVADILARADLFERHNKCQHAFCSDIDRKGDVRVLCNNRSNERWMGTMLHEFGHAVYDKFHDPNLPYLLREPAHTLTTEAIALFMGRLTKDSRWLARYAEVATEEAERISIDARHEARNHLLIFLHWCLVMAHFERALYADPEQDLNRLWWDLVERYQRVMRPEGRDLPDWASKIHLASAPVYYQNYLLGEMVASQLLHTLETHVLSGEDAAALIASPKVGSYLHERLFLPGAARPWEEWLEVGTGEKLNPEHFVKQLQS